MDAIGLSGQFDVLVVGAGCEAMKWVLREFYIPRSA
jgi:hypothetical protein